MLAAIEHGYMPAGKYVFNHDVMHCTADGVVGNELYSGRALGITETWDHIQLHPSLKKHWSDITRHYRRIGLSHSTQVIWNLDRRHLGGHIGYLPSVFFYGPHEHQNWGDNKWLSTVEYIKSKNNFITLAKKLDVHVPKTFCYDDVNQIELEKVHEIGFPCYLKAAFSIAGARIYRCETQEELTRAMSRFEAGMAVQIQEEVIAESFVSMQYRVTENDVIRLSASEQIIEGGANKANRVPASHEPWGEVDSMAYWLKEIGMQGIFSFDIAVIQTSFGLRFPVIECNPGFNEATYPTLIAQKLNIREWQSRVITTTNKCLDDLEIQDVEYSKSTGEGLIIVNWGTIEQGKLMVMLAGSQEYQEVLGNELEARLCN